MAGEGGRSSFDLKFDLLKNGPGYSFYQVIRLLRLLEGASEPGGPQETSEPQNIRVRPDLSLAFPPSDIAKIEEAEKDRFAVTATFLGLYGPSSPLPTFYSEDLVEEAVEDVSASRDFLDIVNHRLFLLLFRGWSKYRQWLKIGEEKNTEDLERFFCLVGLGDKELRGDLPEAYFLLRYLGLFTQYPRSASGLETLLQDALGIQTVEVLPCLERTVKIPADQRMSLGIAGSLLGRDSFLGEETRDRMGKFRLQIGPLRGEEFRSLLPGNPRHQKLFSLTRLYLVDQLDFDLMLILAEGEAGTACLGTPKWSMLGWDTWVFSSDSLGEVQTVLLPEPNQPT